MNFQSVFKRRESVTVSNVIWQVIPGVGAIVGKTAETMLISFVAVYGGVWRKDVYQRMTGVCERVCSCVIVWKGRQEQIQ